MRRQLLASVACLALAAPASAATYYVAKSGGSNANSCATAQNVSTPKLTVAAGISCLAGGDTLLVRTGVYDETITDSIPSGTSWSNFTRIANYGGETVTLKPTDPTTEVILHLGTATVQQYIELDGIRLDGTNIRYFLAKLEVTAAGEAHHIRLKNAEWIMGKAYVGVLNSGDRVGPIGTNEFINLKIHGNVDNTFDSHLHGLPNEAFYLGTSNNLVELCEIWDMLGGGGQLDNSYSQTQSGNVIRKNYWHDIVTPNAGDPFARIWAFTIYGGPRFNNYFYDNIIGNVGAGGGNQYGFVTAGGGTGVFVWNNTVFHVLGTGIDMNQDGANSGGELKNNVVFNSSTNLGSVAGVTVATNLVGIDPLFVNSAGGDYHLQTASPAKDAGTTIATVADDFASSTRPKGPAYDIGAYEFGSGTSTYIVATTGSDANPGTLAAPFATAQHCADVAQPGDTCQFRTGAFAGFTPPRDGTALAMITFRAYPGESPVIDGAVGTVAGTSYPTTAINGSGRAYVVVDGLAVDGKSLAYQGIELTTSSFITIKNADVQGAIASGIALTGGHDITVRANTLHDNGKNNSPRGTVTDGTWGRGVWVDAIASNVTIVANTIYRNNGEGIKLSVHSNTVTIDSNVVSDNWNANILLESAQTVTVKGNILFNTSASISDASCIANCGLQNPAGIGLSTSTSGGLSGTDTYLTDLTIINNVSASELWFIQRMQTGGYSSPDSNWLIANNTVILTSFAGISLGTGASAQATLSVRNNIFTGTLAGGGYIDTSVVPSSSTVSNNIYHTTGTDKWVWGATNTGTFATWTAASGDVSSQNATPTLVNESAATGTLWGGGAVTAATIIGTFDANFGLQASSTGRDAGATIVAVPTDRVGITRPAGTFFDIGAYELVVAPTVTWVRKAATAAHSSLINTHPMTLAFAGAVAVADRAIVCLVPTRSGSAFPTIASVVDNCGHTYSLDKSQTFADGTFWGRVDVYSAAVTTTCTPTVSVTWTGDGGFALGGVAYSGLSTSGSPVDVSASAHDDTGTSTAPASGNTGVTTAANELVLGCFGDDGYARAYTAGGGAAIITGTTNSDANADLAMTELNSGATGATKSASGTLSAAAPWGQLVVVYKLAGTSTTPNTGRITLLGVGREEPR
jgi:hypothetical protein